jgi:hypothetical protein
MTAEAIRFTWSDAWLLLSIALSTREHGASLKDIIGTGDAINRAIFTPQELRRGLAKLTAAGYVAEQGGRYFVSGAATEFYHSSVTRSRDASQQLAKLEKFLNIARSPVRDDPNYEDPQWPYPALSDEAIGAAVAENHRDFDELYRKLKERKRRK